MKKDLDKQIPIWIVKNSEMTRSGFVGFFFFLYCISFQIFQRKCAVENLEGVQKRATKMIKVVTNIPSEERLRNRVFVACWKEGWKGTNITLPVYEEVCEWQETGSPISNESITRGKLLGQERQPFSILRKHSWWSNTHMCTHTPTHM